MLGKSMKTRITIKPNLLSSDNLSIGQVIRY